MMTASGADEAVEPQELSVGGNAEGVPKESQWAIYKPFTNNVHLDKINCDFVAALTQNIQWPPCDMQIKLRDYLEKCI